MPVVFYCVIYVTDLCIGLLDISFIGAVYCHSRFRKSRPYFGMEVTRGPTSDTKVVPHNGHNSCGQNVSNAPWRSVRVRLSVVRVV